LDEKLLHKGHVTANYIFTKKKHGWTALDIIDAGSSKVKGIQGHFHLLYPFRLNGESAREHQGALILRLWEREVGKAGVCFSVGK